MKTYKFHYTGSAVTHFFKCTGDCQQNLLCCTEQATTTSQNLTMGGLSPTSVFIVFPSIICFFKNIIEIILITWYSSTVIHFWHQKVLQRVRPKIVFDYLQHIAQYKDETKTQNDEDIRPLPTILSDEWGREHIQKINLAILLKKKCS